MQDEKTFTVRDLPRSERPRERLIRFGADKLSSQELLALVIGRGIPQRSVMTIAQELIARFGSIQGISNATITELSHIKGIGMARATQLKAVFELGKRQEIEKENNYESYDIRDPQGVVRAVRKTIKDKAKEHFKLILLNTRNKIIGLSTVSIGTLNASLVHPREVFKDAIRHSASSVVVAHNHPSGNPEPSEEDLKITRRLVDSGKILGIEVLDHIIIGKNAFISLKTKGLL
jgi:DNA repair protein RadC